MHMLYSFTLSGIRVAHDIDGKAIYCKAFTEDEVKAAKDEGWVEYAALKDPPKKRGRPPKVKDDSGE